MALLDRNPAQQLLEEAQKLAERIDHHMGRMENIIINNGGRTAVLEDLAPPKRAEFLSFWQAINGIRRDVDGNRPDRPIPGDPD